MFIVFEWVDWCWKDTQLNMIFSYLRSKNKNLQIWTTKEPTANTESWKKILEKLKWNWFESPKEALELYVKDREEQSSIRKNILSHSVILSSRFDYSTYAYQSVWWDLSFDDIYSYHNYKNILLPDITFIFDVSKENIEKRLSFRWWEKEFFENMDFLDKVRENYLKVYNFFKNDRKIFLIDANLWVDEVFEQVKKVIDIYF